MEVEGSGCSPRTSTAPVKRKHSVSTFQKDWSKSWPCIQPVRGSPQRAVFNVTFSIAHQGRRDVERHLDGSEHKRLAWVVNSCLSLASFLPDRSVLEKVTNAEVLFTAYIWNIICNLKLQPMLVLCSKKMFPDSEIAKKYGCAATTLGHRIDSNPSTVLVVWCFCQNSKI